MVAADENPTGCRQRAEGSDTKPGRSRRCFIISTSLLLLSILIVFHAIDAAATLRLLRRSHAPPATATSLLAEAVTAPETANWISAELYPNFTSTLLSRWLAPGGTPCRDASTSNITVPGLDSHPHFPGRIQLLTGNIHKFLVHAVDDNGSPRCLGGDYFEVDLAGSKWKSRPQLLDHGNGSYTLSLQVHQDFAGLFNFTVVLLFRRFEGLKFSPERFAYQKELRRMEIEFYKAEGAKVELSELKLCRREDLRRTAWAGRWTRQQWKEDCDIDAEGRYRCLDLELRCQEPWCYGPLGSLESNGWVYSAHCSFRLFSQAEAWKCLHNRWLFFWGDSNHVDTIRNILNFILGLSDIKSVPRRFDLNFTDPSDPSRSFRITSIFNGHWNESLNYEGLNSLQDPSFRSLLRCYFDEPHPPDIMILNSGLHDGVRWRSLRAFVKAAEHAVQFFTEVFRKWEHSGKRRPALFYRTTIATGGYARTLAFNPSKMEAFNGVMVEKMRGLMDKGGGGVIDEFDMTFPWHYDNRCNDGVHYGRAPAKAKWKDGEIGHQYFVDLMLGHVLLNAVCNDR